MLKRTLADCREFLAGDHTVLRELLHPAKETVSLGYSLAHGKLAAGHRSNRHALTSSEVYYFIAGQGRLIIDSETCSVEAGSVVYVPPGGTQSLENTGTTDIEFLCLVDPAWRIEDETVLE
ncbi:MAG: cupin domain-containing protein [Nitrospira sp.]|nr:cupin domain-containing protein [Nitrospira sp.]